MHTDVMGICATHTHTHTYTHTHTHSPWKLGNAKFKPYYYNSLWKGESEDLEMYVPYMFIYTWGIASHLASQFEMTEV